MDVPMLLYRLHRPAALLLAVIGLGTAALIWTRVVQTISSAKPVASTMHATSIVWGDLVFQSPPGLGRWLRSHGATYAGWRGHHPEASALLEHRPAPAERTRPVVRPANATGTHATSTTRTATSAKRTTAQRPATTALPTKAPLDQPVASGGSGVQRIFIGLLALLAAVCAFAASLPRVVRNRYPNLDRRIAPYRALLLASAGALMIGIVAGVVLN